MFARYQAFALDLSGNVLPAASVEVWNENTGAKPQLWADKDGATARGNSFSADADGFFYFHVAGGFYRIVVTLGALTREFRWVAVGTAQGVDIPVGGSVTRTVNAAGDIDVLASDNVVIVKKTVGAATNVNVPPAAERSGSDVVIKDGKGDANTNPITPVFDGSELCDGLAGTSYQITTPYGWVKFSPLPDGSGYFCLGSQL